MSTIVILGNDKIGGRAYDEIKSIRGIEIFIDRSTSIKRILKLIKKSKLSIFLALKMALSEVMRSGKKPKSDLSEIKNNHDLLEIIKTLEPFRLVLFRAGLIIDKSVIDTGVKILNIHAARVPDYGGIGSIQKALRDEAFEQCASLHIVTSKIDDGEVVDTEDFILDPQSSYFQNESIAYQAAIKLLIRSLQSSGI